MSNDLLNTIIQPLLMTLIQVLLPVLLGLLAVGAKKLLAKIKASMEADQLAVVIELVRSFVLAAEQSGLKDAVAVVGQEKKMYVLNLLEDELAERGIVIDLKVLDALIEAAVYEQINQFKEADIDL